MNPAIAFLTSAGGLFVMARGLANDQWGYGIAAAKAIFAQGEVGRGEDPAPDGPRRSDLKEEKVPNADYATVDQLEL